VKREKEIPEPSILIKTPCGGTRGMNPKEEWRRGPESNRRFHSPLFEDVQ